MGILLVFFFLQKILKLQLSHKLPNIKRLTLSIGAQKKESDDCLLDLATIANACLNLETFTVEVLTFYPTNYFI